MNEMTINFNGQDYIATYNKQSKYYELNLQAPAGGVYEAGITFTDLLGKKHEDNQAIQVWEKEEIKIETNKVFMWIFDYKDFSVKDIVEIADYEINIDEETNANSRVRVLKKTTAKSKDIIAVKKNNKVIYWGVIDNIQNEGGKKLYEYTIKYITNIFNQNIELLQGSKMNSLHFEGFFCIKCISDENYVVDVEKASIENNTNIVIGGANGGDNQKFYFKQKENGKYTIQAMHSNKYITIDENNNIIQYEETNDESQEWEINKVDSYTYSIISQKTGLYWDVNGNVMGAGTNVSGVTGNGTNAQKFYLEKYEEQTIKKIGIEDFIGNAITENFISNEDTFMNKTYLQLNIKTHTIKNTSVSNVEDRVYNLHTWITNCTQNYDIVYNFSIEDKKLVITIENKTYEKELIDTKAQAISNYTEVFETDVVSKVVVLTSSDTYTLYLLNDRTTTTDMHNTNRAEGKIETVYTEKYEDAEQKALDTMKSNSYNHNITFNLYDRYIKIGTPIAIKTKESIIYDTYISAIKITQNKFIEYTCGNIRIKFIDKLLKERRK